MHFFVPSDGEPYFPVISESVAGSISAFCCTEECNNTVLRKRGYEAVIAELLLHKAVIVLRKLEQCAIASLYCKCRERLRDFNAQELDCLGVLGFISNEVRAAGA